MRIEFLKKGDDKVYEKILLNIMGRVSVRIILITHFLTTVNCPSQETEETTRPVENVTLKMKGLQKTKQLVSGTTAENR